jgi:hypothetical protein
MLLTLAAFYIIDGAPSATSTSVRHVLARVRHRLQQAFDNDIVYGKHSTNIITMIQPPCDSTNHDMQELHLVPLHATYKTTTSRRISD